MNKLEQAYKEMRELLDRWNNQGVNFTVNVHSLYECDYYQAVLKIEQVPEAAINPYEETISLYHE